MNETINSGFKTNQEEHFWACELNKEKTEIKWTMEEEDDEDDYDFVAHTLFLKQAVLGTSATKDERNVVEAETKNFDGEMVKHPFLSLTLGQNDMSLLDLSFNHKTPVVFRLIEGSGPLHLIATHIVDYPSEPDESFNTASETEGEESILVKSKKRKATTPAKGKSKRGKMDSEAASDESMDATNGEMDEEDIEESEESEEDEEDDEEDEDSEEESPKKSKKAGGKAKKKENGSVKVKKAEAKGKSAKAEKAQKKAAVGKKAKK